MQIFLGLVQITLFIFGFIFVLSLCAPLIQQWNTMAFKWLLGLLFGLFGSLSIMLSIEVLPGIVIDLRSPFVIVAGVVGGLPGGLVAGGIVAAYRLWLGGAGALAGTLAILGNIPLGLLGCFLHQRYGRPFAPLLGVVSVGISLGAGWLLLPPEVMQVFISQFWLVALALYPLTTFLLVAFWQREVRNRNMQEKLYQSEQRFRTIFNNVFQFEGLLLPDGKTLAANQAALDFAGLTLADVAGKPFWEAHWWQHDPEKQKQLQAAIQRAAGGEHVRYQVAVQGRDGELRTIDFSLSPVFDRDGQVTHLIPEGRDITDHLLSQERQRQLDAERQRAVLMQQFIEDAAHHLRTPITIINTSNYLLGKITQQLQEALPATHPSPHRTPMTDMMNKLHKRHEVIQRGVDDLTRVVENMLELSRLENPSTDELNRVHVTVLLDSVVGRMKTMASQNQITLCYTPPTQNMWCLANEHELSLVFQNVLENAIYYSQPGNEVQLLATQGGGWLTVTVVDNGIGIPKADQQYIFDRFYRAENAQKARTKGTGLGLAIVRRIVEKYDGKLDVTSEEGRGTTVSITLPIILAGAEPPYSSM